MVTERTGTRALDWWAEHRWVDCVVGLVVALGYVGWRAAGGEALAVLDGGSRATLYAALAGTAGALLAFAITPIAIVLALAPGVRLKALLKYHGDELRRTLMAALWGVLALLVVNILALALDTGEGDAGWIRYVVLGVAVQALLAVACLLRTFGLLLFDIGRDQQSDAEPLRSVDSTTADGRSPSTKSA